MAKDAVASCRTACRRTKASAQTSSLAEQDQLVKQLGACATSCDTLDKYLQ
jgi:hypothetical protein